MGSAADWLFLAESDLKTAKAALDNDITNTTCFHAHQAAEKSLKAVLISLGAETPRVHDLLFLLEQTRTHKPELSRLSSACKFLNKFYISTRYPDVFPGTLQEGLPTAEDAKAAVEYAENVLTAAQAAIENKK